jgi:hypothetical protein
VIGRRPSPRADWIITEYLCGMVLWLFSPAMIHAQSAKTGIAALDEWRGSLTQRLDEDIARLGADTRDEPAAAALMPRLLGPATSSESPRPVLSSARSSQRRFPMIEGILAAQGLPVALTGIVAVESSFNPAALSPKGARGLWQLMPATARRYGLVIDDGRDERLDPWKSTFVAARYLHDLYAQFQDWLLVLAAYNAGEGRVQNAVEHFGARDFWTLSHQRALPEETRRYVPAVLDKSGGWPEALAGMYPATAAAQFRPGLVRSIGSEPEASRAVYAVTSPIAFPVQPSTPVRWLWAIATSTGPAGAAC